MSRRFYQGRKTGAPENVENHRCAVCAGRGWAAVFASGYPGALIIADDAGYTETPLSGFVACFSQTRQ
jgi:hypothetical protein